MADEYLPSAKNANTVLPGARQVQAPAQPQQAQPQQAAQPQQPAPAPQQSGADLLQDISPEQQARLNLVNDIFSIERPDPVAVGAGASAARGFFNTSSSILNLFGADEWRNAADSLAAKVPREVADYQDIKDWGDLGTYAVESALENTANLLVVLGGSTLGALAGPAVGGTAAVGGIVGTAASGGLLATGETVGELERAGVEPTVTNVAPAALTNTALETFSFLKVFKNAGLANFFGDAVENAAEISGLSKNLKDIGSKSLSSFATEASTEAIQTFVNQVNVELAQNKDLAAAIAVLPDEQKNLLDSFLRGGFGGGLSTATSLTTIKAAENIGRVKNLKSNASPVQDGETIGDTQETRNEKEAVIEDNPEAPPKEASTATVSQETAAEDVIQQDADLGATEALTKVNEAIAKNLEQISLTSEGININAAQAFENIAGQPAGNVRAVQTSKYDVENGRAVANTIPKVFNGTPVSTFRNGELQSNTININQAQSSPGTYIHGDGKDLFGYKSPRVIKQITEIVETWRAKYTPERSIVLGRHDPEAIESSETAQGYQTTLIDDSVALEASAQGITQLPISYVVVRPDAIKDSAIRGAQARKQDIEVREKDILALSMTTLAHEVGHGIIANQVSIATPEEKAGIYGEYRQFLESIPDKTYGEVMQELGSSASPNFKHTPKEVLDRPFTEVAQEHYTENQLNYLLSFEEYAAEQIAKNFTGTAVPNSKFWGRALATLRQFFADFAGLFKTKPSFKAWLENLALKNYRNELLTQVPATEFKINADLKEVIEEAGFGEPRIKPLEQDDISGRIIAPFEGSLDDAIIASMKRTERVSTGFNKIWGKILTPTQIAERFRIPQAAEYMEAVQRFYNTKMRGIAQADEISKQWLDLPQQQADDFSRAIFDMSELSDSLERRLLPSERLEILREHGLGDKELGIYEQVQGSFNEVLTRLRNAVELEALSQYTTQPEVLRAELERVGESGRAKVLSEYAPGVEQEAYEALTQAGKQLAELENRDYFPRMRFGQYTITVKKREKNPDGSIREVVDVFEAYESKKERDEAAKFYSREFSKRKEYDVIAGAMSDTARAMYGMPQVVVQSIGNKIREAEGTLTPEQEEALRQAEIDLSPGKAFLKQLRRRKNTKGFSTDALRTYAAYMSSASNHLARIEHNRDMTGSLASLARARSQFAGDVTDLEQLHGYYQEHFKYLFNPENDLAQLRAFGFNWYLGFNVKSAFVNMTQIPLVTLPYLSARYGEVASVKELTKAYGRVARHTATREKLTEEEQRVLDRMTQEGAIDEGMASELAALSEGSTLQRVIPANKAHKLSSNFAYYSSFFFRATEKYNRRVTAIATFNLHMKKGQDFEQAYQAAKNSVQKTQFEYAKWNRPEFQRGKKSVLTLFYGYIQQYLYLITNGARTQEGRKTALYMAAILFAFSGLQGLPGAEYLLNSIDFLGTRFKRAFGLNDPRVNIKEDIRDIVETMGADPDIFMHGASRYYGTGPLQLANMFGVPVPNVDISGSLSLGQPLPGIRETLEQDPSLGDLLINAMGPVPNIANNVYKALGNDDPDSWKRFEKTMPIALKNISAATRWATREKETTRGNAEFLPFDGANPDHWAEIMFKALGFTPSRVSEKWSVYGEQASGAAYWTTRRQGLMERYAYAISTKDKDALIEARKDISHWNKVLTKPELKPYKISNVDLQRSLKAKMRTIRLRELGRPTTTRDRLYYNAVEERRAN